MKSLFFKIKLLTIFIISTWVETLFAATPYVTLDWNSYFNSNVYLNAEQEEDWVNAPALGFGLDFGDTWTSGYQGMLEAYLLHEDLFFHNHELFLLSNPLFGPNGEREFTAELSLETQRNSEAFASLNIFEPTLFLEFAMESPSWLRWSLSETVYYQWFYDDSDSNTLTSWTRAELMFTAKTRTTFTPRIAYGLRYFTTPPTDEMATAKRTDQQLESGFHFSQGITRRMGLQADYAYVHAFDDSVLILRKLDDVAFDFIGDSFIYSGHRALLGLKALFDIGVSTGLHCNWAYKKYGGWEVTDEADVSTGEERTDHELGAKIWVKYTYTPKEEASPAAPVVSISPYYTYLRVWSNDPWFDTTRHLAGLSLELAW